jgi:hypothetical protein
MVLNIKYIDNETNVEGFKSNANRFTFFYGYGKKKNRVCGACSKRFEWFITFRDIRWWCRGNAKDGHTKKTIDQDILDWTELETYKEVKRAVEEGKMETHDY